MRTLRKDAENKLANNSEQVDLWIKSLVDIEERLTSQVAMMGMEGLVFSIGKHEVLSAKLGILFNELIERQKSCEEGRDARFASESRKLACNALFMVLRNIAYCHPDLNLTDGFRKLSAGADVFVVEQKAASFSVKVLSVPRAT